MGTNYAEIVTRLIADTSSLERGFRSAGDKADALGQRFRALGLKLAAAFAVERVVAFSRKLVSAAAEVDDTAQRIGMSAESVQSLTVSAKLCGAEFADFEAVIHKLKHTQADALAGNSSAIAAYDAMGVSLSVLAGMSPEGLFDAVAKSLHDNAGEASVVSAAYDVMGRGAGTVLEKIKELGGEGGLEKLNAELVKAGKISCNDAVKGLGEVADGVESLMRTIDTSGQLLLASFAHFFNLAPLREAIELTDKEARKAVAARRKETLEAEALAREAADNAARIAREQASDRAVQRADADALLAQKQRDAEWEWEEAARKKALAAWERGQEAERAREQSEQAADQRANEDALREQAELRRESAEWEWEHLAWSEKAARLEQRKAELAAEFNSMVAAGSAETSRVTANRREALLVERQLEDIYEGQTRSIRAQGDEWRKIGPEQADILERMRKAFGDLSPAQIDKFVGSLKRLAEGLADGALNRPFSPFLAQLSELLQSVSGFRLPNLNSSNAGAMGLGGGISELIRSLNITPEDEKKINRLKGLTNILAPLSGFRLPLNLSPMSWGALGDSVHALITAAALPAEGVDFGFLDAISRFRLPEWPDEAAQKFRETVSGISAALRGVNVEAIRALTTLIGSAWPNTDLKIEVVGTDRLPRDGVIRIDIPEGGVPLDTSGLDMGKISSALTTISGWTGVLFR